MKKWALFAAMTVIVWSIGLFIFGANGMSECFPQYADFEDCISDKRRDAVVIVIVTVGLWLGFSFLIFRKRPKT